MNLETQFKVQAFVDGELSANEAAQIETLIATDAEARRLADALRGSRDTVRQNEPGRAVPETREFYWSKISREIEWLEREEARPVAAAWKVWLWRLLAPAGGVAALALLLMMFNTRPAAETTMARSTYMMPGTISFYLQDEDVTIVWVDSGLNSGFTETTSDVNVGVQ